MPYCIYKLKFLTPVHFGSETVGTSLDKTDIACHADTLFSALYQEALMSDGEGKLESFVNFAKKGEFLLSDLFPYKDDNYFLPKPFLYLDKQEKTQEKEEPEDTSIQKKKMKKLSYISVNDWNTYLGCLKTGEKFKPAFDDNYNKFAEKTVFQKVGIPRTDDDNEGKNKLYSVGAYSFEENAGLYFIVKYETEETVKLLKKLLKSLRFSGIGGKRTTGYGKFELLDDLELDINSGIKEEKLLLNLFNTENSDYLMTLSVVSPSEDELNQDFSSSFYSLIKRNGFVQSATYSDNPLKRKSLVMFNAGSCFSKDLDLKGCIRNLQDTGKHPVHRYGKALMIGIKGIKS